MSDENRMHSKVCNMDWVSEARVCISDTINMDAHVVNGLWNVLMRTNSSTIKKNNDINMVRKLNLKFIYVNQHDSVSDIQCKLIHAHDFFCVFFIYYWWVSQ
jgi:hypothetical protein